MREPMWVHLRVLPNCVSQLLPQHDNNPMILGVGIYPLHLLMLYPRMPSAHDTMSPHPHPPSVPSRDAHSPLLHRPGWCRGHVTTPPSPLHIAMGRDTMSPPPLRLSWHTAQHRCSRITLVQGTQHDDTLPLHVAMGCNTILPPLVPLLAHNTTSPQCHCPFAVALGRDTMSLLPYAAESVCRPPFPFSPPLACKPWPA